MKSFKLILLTALAGASSSLQPGDELVTTPEVAWKMIKTGQAEPAEDESLEELEKFITDKEEAEAEKQAQIIAIKQKEDLISSAQDHIAALGEILSTLSTVHADAVSDIVSDIHSMMLSSVPNSEISGSDGDPIKDALEAFAKDHNVDLEKVEQASEANEIKIEVTKEGALYKKVQNALIKALGIEEAEA